MKRITLAVALLAGVAGCGPDCDRFCKHWVGDCNQQLNIKITTTVPEAVSHCVTGCNQVGGDYTSFIDCAIDKSCDDLGKGACQIPSTPPGFTQ